MNSLRIALSGYGRMGSAVHSACADAADMQIVATSLQQVRDGIATDVIIDFSSPECLMQVMQTALAHKTALVIGTTGLTQEHFQAMQEASEHLPIIYAANFSVGVHVIASHLRELSRQLRGMSITVRDKHHVHKKDSPSGTAFFLKAHLPDDAAIESTREGETIGVHSVTWSDPDEEITISHTALSRSVFANGALQAAKWIFFQKKGLYSVEDMIQ